MPDNFEFDDSKFDNNEQLNVASADELEFEGDEEDLFGEDDEASDGIDDDGIPLVDNEDLDVDDESELEEDEDSSDGESDDESDESGFDNPDDFDDYDEGDADESGTVIGDGGLGLDEDEVDYSIANSDENFINSSGDFVVQDADQSGEDSFDLKYIAIDNITIVPRIRKNNNVEDLQRSIRSTGLLQPITVAPLITEGHYVLLDGYRRLLACAKAGIPRIPCIINVKIKTPEIPILEAMYNHNKPYNTKEMIDYINYLEKEKGIFSPSMIEYLLQMDSGDYSKLKDILNDDDDDIVSKLMNGQFTIAQAFKALEKRRKNESREEKDLKKTEQVYEGAEESGAKQIEGSGEEGDTSLALSDEEISELSISAGELDSVSGESLEDLAAEGENIAGFQPHKQDPGHREYLDPALRKAVLARDDNTCQICKIISGQEYTEVLDIHHITEVYLGGSDAIENLITACVCCHKLIHLFGRGELHIRPESELTEQDKEKFKRVVKLGTVIRKGMAARGMKKEQLKKLDNAETIGRTKPGTPRQVAG